MTEQPSNRVKRIKHRPQQHKTLAVGEEMPGFQRSPSDITMRSVEKNDITQSARSSVSEHGFEHISEPNMKDQFHNTTNTAGIKNENNKSTGVTDILSQDELAQTLLSNTPVKPNMDFQHSTMTAIKSTKKQALSHRKSIGTSDDQSEFEMDESIQKSTIMMKRLRSKSEKNEYEAGKDPGQIQLEQAPSHKRHLQDNWGLSILTEDMSLTGEQLSQNVKENYLWSLSKSSLVKLITRIEANSPTVRLYPSRLSSPITSQFDYSNFSSAPPAPLVQTPMPVDLAQSSSQLMAQSTPSPNQPMQDVQSDYFESMVTHFQPTMNTTLSNIQEIGDSLSLSSAPKAVALKVRSGLEDPSKSNASSQPTTPNTPKNTSRLSTGSGTGTGVTGTYHSVKAQELPPYEEMIFMAIADMKQEAGSAPKAILDWVQGHYPVPETFRASCGQAISKAAKKGRLLKEGAMYKLKPGYNYPRRVSRHTGPTRARSQSYNSALPPGIPVIDASSRGSPMNLHHDQINSIIDTNLYGMLSSPAFQVPPHAAGVPTINAQQRLQQAVHPFKFDDRLIGHAPGLQKTSNQDPVNGNESKVGNSVSGPVGLGVTNIPSGKTGENDNGADSDSTRRSSSMSSVSSGPHSYTGAFQAVADAHSVRTLQSQVQRPQLLQQPMGQDRVWAIGGTSGNNQPQGGLVGVVPPTAAGNPLSIMTGGLQQQSIYPGQVLSGRVGVASPLQYNSSSFTNLGPITLSSQSQSPQLHPTFPSQITHPHGPMTINTTLKGAGGIGQGPESTIFTAVASTTAAAAATTPTAPTATAATAAATTAPPDIPSATPATPTPTKLCNFTSLYTPLWIYIPPCIAARFESSDDAFACSNRGSPKSNAYTCTSASHGSFPTG
ncbi:hypothetical protein BGZ46_007026 [Entomortierella lignicola]|nr:hypothetical protein BGZ46_007026 [Entomortierella lignicola]